MIFLARRPISPRRHHLGLAALLALAALLMCPASAAHAQGRSAGGPPLDVAGLAVAGFEDYTDAAGRIQAGALQVTLEARPAAWYPWGPDGRGLRAHVFAVEGEAARMPGPMLRVSAGTPVHVRVRNTFPDTLLVRGLADRGGASGGGPAPNAAPLVVPPGETGDARFTPTVPGTYFYFGRVLEGGWSAGPPPGLPADGVDRALVGVLIVDPPGAEPPAGERIFLISHWADRNVAGSWLPATRFMINGRSWPHTERLTYAEGDTVRWRVINNTGREHPMHLHGFYFTVDARGDQTGEVAYAPEERRLAVTETLLPAETMRLTWIPTEPGNWIFHCHFMRHMSWLQTTPLDEEPHDHAPAGAVGEDLMGGLVLGIEVRAAGSRAAPAAEPVRRRLDLHIGTRPGVFDGAPGYGFVLQEGAEPPAPDSIRFPGSPLVLHRGEPTEIVVHNRADVALGVHWHGLELESWADGVPGWSGTPGATRPATAPGDSFVVRMTPPRAGSFMYHVHSEPGHQLAQGLYGPFLVLEPGETWDTERDRVFLLGSLGTGTDPAPAVNGEREPGSMELVAGATYRLRFMHISPDDDKRVALLAAGEPVTWRLVAKDGADLPPAQARTVPAELRIHVGETYDVLWTPAEGDYSLRVLTTFDRGAPAFPRDAPEPMMQEVAVRVRAGL